MTSKIEEARYTCKGLGSLIRKLNSAAVDIDNGAQSAHELLALLATTNECIYNLTAQLESLHNDTKVPIRTSSSNVSTLNTKKNEATEPFHEDMKVMASR